MLALESFIQRHPTVDSKKNRLKINLALTGIDILAIQLVFGAAAVGAAQGDQDQPAVPRHRVRVRPRQAARRQAAGAPRSAAAPPA